jgi:excisionase family DNA binding protein
MEKARSDYTVKEVAFYASKSEHTVRRQISEGTLRAVRVGGSVRIQHPDLVRYLHRDPFDNADDK